MSAGAAEAREHLPGYKQHLLGERNLSELTVRNYLDDLTPLFQSMELQGVDSLAQVDRAFLRRYISWLMSSRPIKSGGSQWRHGHDRASVTRHLASLRSFFRYLTAEGVVAPDPLWKRGSRQSRSLIPKAEKPLPRVVDKEEMERLVNAPDNPEVEGKPKQVAMQLRDKAILELLYATGLRVSELSGLDLGDLDLERRVLRALGKGSKEREVVMGRPAQQALEAYIREARPLLMALPADGRPFPQPVWGPPYQAFRAGDGEAVRPSLRRRQGASPHAASQLCHSHAGRRRRPAHSTGTVGPLLARYNADIYARKPCQLSRRILERASESARRRGQAHHEQRD